MNPGFPTGVVNIGGGSSKFDGGGELKSKHAESMGELKILLKNTCEGVHKVASYKPAGLQIY